MVSTATFDFNLKQKNKLYRDGYIKKFKTMTQNYADEIRQRKVEENKEDDFMNKDLSIEHKECVANGCKECVENADQTKIIPS